MAGTVPASLVAAARAGDREALAQVLRLAQPDIRRFARRACRISVDVDDAVQETLWLVARRVTALRSINSSSGWVAAIVLRQCLRLARLAGLAAAENIEDHAARIISRYLA